MAEITLRKIEPDDEEFLLRVYSSTREEELALVGWTDEQKEAFLFQQFRAQSEWWRENYTGADFRIIEADGVPAGRFYVHRGRNELRLVDIALLPEHRGGGIGTRLIQSLFAEAVERGVPVTAHVETFNPARGLYRRLGFEEVENRGVYLFLRWRPEAVGAEVS